MKTLIKLLPWFCLALFGAEIAALIAPKQDGDFHWREFGRLPVLHSGRIQPFDSLARNALLQIRSTGDVPLEEVPSWKFWHHPKKLKSTEWLLEVLARPEVADTRPIFLIHHADVLGELKLQDSGVEKSGLRYYTFKQLEPVIKEIEAQGQKAGQVKAEDQTSFQKQILKLANAAELYKRLKATLQPEGVDDFLEEAACHGKVHFAGLMCMPPLFDDSGLARPYFAETRELAARLSTKWRGTYTFDQLSMGTSADYEVAVEEGATIVRVGSVLF